MLSGESSRFGVRPLEVTNRAMLNKWLWRFEVERDALWRRLMAAKYEEDHLGWSCRHPEGAIGCCVWKNISKGKDDFFHWIRFKDNDGGRVRFYLDPWCFRDPLAIIFPNCFNLAVNKRGTVKEHMKRSGSICSWNIEPRRNLNDWEIEEMGRLMESLERYELRGRGQSDEMIWILDEDNGFSVKSMSEALRPSNQLSFPRDLCLEPGYSFQSWFFAMGIMVE